MHQAAGHLGRLVKAGVAHGVGQASVGVAADEGVLGHAVELLDVGAHQRGTQSAVQADGQRARVAHAVPEGSHRLPAQDAAGGVRHGTADDEGQALAALFKELVNRKQRGLGVQGVEDGFDQQHVGAAFDQCLGLLVVRRAQLLKVDVARARVVHIGADAGRLGCGAQGTGHKAGVVGRAELVAGGTGQLGRLEIHLTRQLGHAVVFLRDGGGAKRVGLDQVGTSGQVAFVDVADHIGARQAQQLVVALHIAGKVLEPVTCAVWPGVALPPVLGLTQLEALDHGAHGAIEDDDALGEDGGQLGGAGVVKGLHSRLL